MLLQADGVITRSQKAIDIHLKTINNQQPEKFTVVLNGRDTHFFKPEAASRKQVRAELNILEEATVFVYCGSLGPQYGWSEMIEIFEKYQQRNTTACFLILTGNTEFALQRIPNQIADNIIVKKVPFEQVPKYEQERIEIVRSRIKKGLEELQNIQFDTNRLEQEMIFYIEKLDVSEEKMRLSNHLDYYLETMVLPKSGKKLGFISQEIGREINTLGSKSNQADMQKLVVDMKDSLEKIKEQILNTL
jgi:glycosyltransferase involved in cell wall biosynthesis